MNLLSPVLMCSDLSDEEPLPDYSSLKQASLATEPRTSPRAIMTAVEFQTDDSKRNTGSY